MDKCEHPECQSNIQMELNNKASKFDIELLKKCSVKHVHKKHLWIALVILGLPLLITGVEVWSQQGSDHLRYVNKDDMAAHEKKQARLEEKVSHMAGDIRDIRIGQVEVQKDVKEILKYLRDK